MKQYNGHRSWNAWNVSLWLGNDKQLYLLAMDCIKESKRVAAKLSCKHQVLSRIAGRAARYFMDVYKFSRTPDGAAYNHLSVKLAMEGFLE